MHILHAPTATGGNAFGLSRAERKLGHISDSMVFSNNWLNYPVDIDLHYERLNRFEREAARINFFSGAVEKYDVFNFNFAETLFSYPKLNLWHVDLPLLKLLGKKMAFIFQGCDMRLKSSSLERDFSPCKDCKHGYCEEFPDKIKKRKYEKFRKYSAAVYCLNPDICRQYDGLKFMPYASVDFRDWQPVEKAEAGTLTIAHASTNRDKKGSRYIIETVEKLKDERKDVEFLLIENMPYEEAKKHFQNADIVIDQVLIGWYGAFAVEMMALKKPVVCYINEEDLVAIPPEMKKELPLYNATKYNLLEKLRVLCSDAKLRMSLGERGRKFVEKWHDPLIIAKQLIEEYSA